MIERKCLKCGTWNGAEDFCTQCGAALSPTQIIKEEEIKKEAEALKVPKSKLEILFFKMRDSKYLPVRILFYMLSSVGFIVVMIASFMAYMVGMTSG